MTAHFPVWMFFSARRQAVVSPTSLLYLPARPFMDNTGGLSVVLLRDEFSAETPAKEKESMLVLPKGPSVAACLFTVGKTWITAGGWKIYKRDCCTQNCCIFSIPPHISEPLRDWNFQQSITTLILAWETDCGVVVLNQGYDGLLDYMMRSFHRDPTLHPEQELSTSLELMKFLHIDLITAPTLKMMEKRLFIINTGRFCKALNYVQFVSVQSSF